MDLLISGAWHVADAKCIGGHEHLAIRYTLRDPGGVGLLIGQGAHFENPGLGLIGDEQSFAFAVIAMCVDHLAHQPHRLFGTSAPFQGDA